ncbi:MAG: nitroreductase [Phenylobacterium sp.]|uniref:nitroreductase family protein n=1 Tax=Phenylobacterium sp. TaxID=1871053 RepID=UPI0027216BCB|nr:nitroreductase [Phenylobacterium sp.]MDO8901025.1 nitroreductase [Phenylobacterium sp.]
MPQAFQPEVLTFLATRRSASALTLTAPGPDAAEIDVLMRLACRAPDHGKLTPWRMIVLESAAKTEFAARLEALALGREDAKAAAKLAKLKVPPMGVAVVARPQLSEIPEWEQLLSAAVVCTNLLYGATAMGYGANWITDWYAYDPDALKILGLEAGERVAGYILMGSPGEAPLERVRPDPQTLVSRWRA